MSRFLLLATLLAVLLGLTSAQTFCEKYSGTATNASSPSTSQNATLQINLLTAIVTRAALGGSGTGFNGQTVQGLFSSSGPLYNIFTGQTKYRVGAPNYVNDTAALGTLAGKLVSYFGVLFGCNAPGYPQPSNTNMFTVHQNMSINNDMETYFNNQLATTLQSFGVTNQTDLQAAGTALSYFNKCGAPLGGALGSGTSGLTQICGTSDCPIAGNANYATCAQYYGYPASSSGGNGATGKYAAGGLFVAAAAIVASLLL